MRLLSAACLFLAFGTLASADALLSVSATAGGRTCTDQAAIASASCTVSSSVFVPAGQFYSPASASGTLFFGQSTYGDTVSLGPQSLAALDYTLQGNWSMGEGLGLSGQASVSLTAVLNLPSDSGNWTFYGATYDATDDPGGGVETIEVLTSDGDGWISSSSPSFTIAHKSGSAISVSIDLFDSVAESQSSNSFNFDLRMVDPVAAPEPATWFAALAGVSLIALLAKSR